MSKQKSDILSGMGSGFQIMKALRDAGATDEELRRIIVENSFLPAQIVSVLRGGQVSGDGFIVTVDYSKSLAEMVASGHYDWKNSDIVAEHFPTTQKGVNEVKLELVHLDKNASTDEVLRYLDEHGYRPATLLELLAFGAKYPDEQKKYPVVALGSVWRSSGGDRYVACLDCYGAERHLSLSWCGDDWHGRCRFLAVRK